MAYSNSPEQSTYKTERFNFIGSPEQRDGTTTTKDQRFLNVFPEVLKTAAVNGKKYYLRQRPGLVNIQACSTEAEARGIVLFNGALFAAYGNTLYKDGVSFLTLGNSSGTVGFTEYNGTEDALIVLDGIKGFVIEEDWTATEITDADFPTPHIPYPVYLDGFLFVVKSGTADIYNSVLEDPLSWTTGEFFTAEQYPDEIVAMVKMHNYIVAIGKKTVEYMYNAATATGSPLGRNDTAVQQFGTPAAGSVAQSQNDLIMVADTNSGGRSVWVINGFKATEIATEPVRLSLDAEGDNLPNCHAFIVRTAGHRFYVLNLQSRTWVYDIEEKSWHEWAFNIVNQPFVSNFACSTESGVAYVQHPNNGNILKFVETSGADTVATGEAYNIPVVMTTASLDFSTMDRKTCHRLTWVGNMPDTDDVVNIGVSWSDDDYKTWSTARNLNINQIYPQLTQLGLFRRRAFKFTYSSTYPLRCEAFELEINKGS